MRSSFLVFAALLGFVLPRVYREGEGLLPRRTVSDDADFGAGMPPDERWEDWS